MSGGQLPESFRKPDARNFRGGVEYGFMSTTRERSVALHYGAGAGALVVSAPSAAMPTG